MLFMPNIFGINTQVVDIECKLIHVHCVYRTK